MTARKPAAAKSTSSDKSARISLAQFLDLDKPKGDFDVEIDNIIVTLTSIDRVYWPKEKITKYDLLRYYARIHRQILPFLENRPAILKRFPRGIDEPMFFQHDLEGSPSFVTTKRLKNEMGREIEYAVYTDLASLLYLVNLGAIEQHPWNSTIKHLQRPDWIVLDLDPKDAPWKNVLQVALVAREVLQSIGATAFVKTSGSSGIHLYLPLNPDISYQTDAKLAAILATRIADKAPKIATVERSLAARQQQQVYVDSLQNARGKSVAAPFTVRAKPKATVSMPLEWGQVEDGVRISDFTIKNAADLISTSASLWKAFFDSRQSLSLRSVTSKRTVS